MIRLKYSRLYLVLALGIGLIHGLVYVFLVPPWQHNDEPNHFEVVWLTADLNTIPNRTAYDPELSRKVMQSMVFHHFFDDQSYVLEADPTEQIRIEGYSQLGDPPLYYWMVSLPLRLLKIIVPNTNIETQLYTVRLASLGLFLISILAVFGLVCELTRPSNPLRWLVPLTLVLWPGFVDLMTAVTNIVGAVAFFSLFMWASVHLIQTKRGWKNLAWIVLTCLACVYTLSGLYIAIPLAFLAVLISLFEKRYRWIVLVTGTSISLAILWVVFTWGEADLWYRESLQAEPARVKHEAAPLGEYAFHLVVPAAPPQNRLYQFVPPDVIQQIDSHILTIGAWIWTTYPLQAVAPTLSFSDGSSQHLRPIQVSDVPGFYAFTVTLPMDIKRAWIELSAPISKEQVGTGVYFDGVVVAEGIFPLDIPPEFDSSVGTQGMWGNLSFENLLRNSSAEKGWLGIHPRVDRHQLFGSHGRVSMLVYASRDWSGMEEYYRTTAVNLFRTLWGRFGWNHVSFLGNKPYRALFIFTGIGLVGMIISLYPHLKSIPWKSSIWLVFSVTSVGFLAIERGVFYTWYQPFIPGARYLYPVMGVVVILFCIGWWRVLGFLERWVPSRGRAILYFSFFIGLDILAVISIVRYYTQ